MLPHSGTKWEKNLTRVPPCLAKLISAQGQGQGSRALCLESTLESSDFSTLQSAAVRSGSGHACGVK